MKLRKITLIVFIGIFLLTGCGVQVYMLDAPVNDPIMFARENQNMVKETTKDAYDTTSVPQSVIISIALHIARNHARPRFIVLGRQERIAIYAYSFLYGVQDPDM